MKDVFYHQYFVDPVAGFAIGTVFFLALAIVVAWTIFWKGMALWKSARAGSKIWFVVFLLVNTLGILEILYIYVFSKKAKSVGSQHD